MAQILRPQNGGSRQAWVGQQYFLKMWISCQRLIIKRSHTKYRFPDSLETPDAWADGAHVPTWHRYWSSQGCTKGNTAFLSPGPLQGWPHGTPCPRPTGLGLSLPLLCKKTKNQGWKANGLRRGRVGTSWKESRACSLPTHKGTWPDYKRLKPGAILGNSCKAQGVPGGHGRGKRF